MRRILDSLIHLETIRNLPLMVSKLVPGAFARCGAAARRADLPPATLRVWERRYAVVGPQRSPAGQRLYSEEDVRRLKILKRVVERGYAIGTVARLSTEQLELLAMATNSAEPRQRIQPLLKWVIVGPALQERLSSFAFVMTNHLAFDNLTAAIASLEPGSADVIIVHSPTLGEDMLPLVFKLVALHAPTPVAVVYSYGVAKVVSKLRDGGIRLLRDPLNRIHLSQALDELAHSTAQYIQQTERPKLERVPRLFDDQALAILEQRTTTIACECPTHLTALVSQLTAFEKYSDECTSADSRDAILHRHIGDVASQARSMLESLLQCVAAHEGLPIDFKLDD